MTESMFNNLLGCITISIIVICLTVFLVNFVNRK